MATLYLDFETPISATASLSRMTLHQYLTWVRSQGGILGLAWAVDEDEVQWQDGMPPAPLMAELAGFASDPTNVIVAHNAAFDSRVITDLLGIEIRAAVRCSLELAYAAWPNQPGALRHGTQADDRDPHGYSLASLAQTLALGMLKLDCNLLTPNMPQLAAYCIRDVELCRAIYRRAVARLSPQEIRISELANQVRELKLDVNLDRVNEAIAEFDATVASARDEAVAVLGASASGVFGTEVGGRVRSVKAQKLRRLLLVELGFDTPTTSYKKLNPAKLSAAPQAAALLKATGEANKGLSHRRRVGVFAGVDKVHCELGYARAHTFRYSSPSVGKGLNLHNIPKRNKRLAKAIRSMYAFPDGHVAVRADLSNVEYRGTGLLAGCAHTTRLFTADIMADPYAAFWFAATGQRISKKDAARQIAKAAVLGLSFLMGLGTWTSELMKALADPSMGLTLQNFTDIADAQNWVSDRYARGIATKLNAPDAVVRVAQGTHRAFHGVHPEILRLAQWLEAAVTDCSRSLSPQNTIDDAYDMPGAPDRNMIDLIWEDSPDLERSVRVRVGGWHQPTVTWRDVGTRFVSEYGTGMCLSSRQAGSKGYRPLTKNILIENTAQAWARNGLVKGKLLLDQKGYPYILSVHDEAMLIVPNTREDILRARDDLLEVYGPGNRLGYDWACVINPDEINVSRTLFEHDMGLDWWDRLRKGDETLLENLP